MNVCPDVVNEVQAAIGVVLRNRNALQLIVVFPINENSFDVLKNIP